MATQIIKIDNLQTRLMQSFINLTNSNSSLYPALTVLQVDKTFSPPLSTYQVYDQFALRLSAVP
jgi:hypothetical protein